MEEAFKTRGDPVTKAMDATKGKPVEERVTAIVEALKRGGMFLMGQDLYRTRSAEYGHLVLPAAGWGEMNLTSINGERRLRIYEKFMDPPGDAKPDWSILAHFARALNALYTADNNPQMANRFLDYDWKSDEDVFIHARYSYKGQGTDPMEGYAGVTYDMLRGLGSNGIQTPTRLVNGVAVGTVRLFEDGKFRHQVGQGALHPGSSALSRLWREVRTPETPIPLLGKQRAHEPHLADAVSP